MNFSKAYCLFEIVIKILQFMCLNVNLTFQIKKIRNRIMITVKEELKPLLIGLSSPISQASNCSTLKLLYRISKQGITQS